MDISKAKSVAFTGYRTFKILRSTTDVDIISTIKLKLRRMIIMLYEQGYVRYLSGGAEGFDLIAAEVVLDLKQEHSDIQLVMVVPFRGQEESYKQQDRALYDELLIRADEVLCLSESYNYRVFFDRNDYLVDNSSVVVCYYDGQKGGTQYTYKKAKRCGCQIINLCNYTSPQLSLF